MVTCYMCQSASTSVEHVPPRCLFPKPKDLPPGVQLRKQLITVPSCDVHNGDKSRDDQYLLYVLAMNLPANGIAGNHFASAIMRSVAEKPLLIQRMTANPKPVLAVDERTGEKHHTFAIEIDHERLTRSLEHVARALYFHHFSKQWKGSVRIEPEFLLVSLDPADARERNAPGERIVHEMDRVFQDVEAHGENPGVFKYQVVSSAEPHGAVMRLHFYEGCKVTLVFCQV